MKKNDTLILQSEKEKKVGWNNPSNYVLQLPLFRNKRKVGLMVEEAEMKMHVRDAFLQRSPLLTL